MFYESSTRKLVNILESLSSQLTGPCTTRHCPDTDSFDSVLSRSAVWTVLCVVLSKLEFEKRKVSNCSYSGGAVATPVC